MKTKVSRVKKPKNTSLFYDRVKVFSKYVEKLSGEKRKPAEYTIIENPSPFVDEAQLTVRQNQCCALCSIQQNY